MSRCYFILSYIQLYPVGALLRSYVESDVKLLVFDQTTQRGTQH